MTQSSFTTLGLLGSRQSHKQDSATLQKLHQKSSQAVTTAARFQIFQLFV